MTVLLTGATGYTGYFIARKFIAASIGVHAITRPESDISKLQALGSNIKFHVLDGSVGILERILEEVKPDTVFHLASDRRADLTGPETAEMITTNVAFPITLVEAMLATGVTNFVNAGSFWQFGADGQPAPNCLYAVTKQLFQNSLDYFAHHRGLNAISLILYDVYGPGDWRKKFIHILMQARNGQSLKMTHGEQKMDMVYIGDVVQAFMQARDVLSKQNGNGSHTSYNTGTGRSLSLRKIVGIFEDISKTPLRIEWGAMPYRKFQIFKPCPLSSLLPGWAAKTSLEDGFRKILEQHSLTEDEGLENAQNN